MTCRSLDNNCSALNSISANKNRKEEYWESGSVKSITFGVDFGAYQSIMSDHSQLQSNPRKTVPQIWGYQLASNLWWRPFSKQVIQRDPNFSKKVVFNKSSLTKIILQKKSSNKIQPFSFQHSSIIIQNFCSSKTNLLMFLFALASRLVAEVLWRNSGGHWPSRDSSSMWRCGGFRKLFGAKSPLDNFLFCEILAVLWCWLISWWHD